MSCGPLCIPPQIRGSNARYRRALRHKATLARRPRLRGPAPSGPTPSGRLRRDGDLLELRLDVGDEEVERPPRLVDRHIAAWELQDQVVRQARFEDRGEALGELRGLRTPRRPRRRSARGSDAAGRSRRRTPLSRAPCGRSGGPRACGGRDPPCRAAERRAPRARRARARARPRMRRAGASRYRRRARARRGGRATARRRRRGSRGR